MPAVPLCTACRTPHHRGEVEPGTLLFCDTCGEVFEAGDEPPTEVVLAEEGSAAAEPHPEPPTPANEGRGTRLILAAVVMVLLNLMAVVGAGFFVMLDRIDQVRIENGQRAERAEAERATEREAEAERRRREATRLMDLERKLARLAAQVEPLADPGDPYKPGTQTKLREMHAVELPKIPGADRGAIQPTPAFTKLVHAPKHNLLFALSTSRVWVFDLKANRAIRAQAAQNWLADMSLSPDQAVLFAADYGMSDNSRPSYVHRFDLAVRGWETRKAPGVAGKVAAIGPNRLLLLEPASWTFLTLNRWEADRPVMTELSRYRAGWAGNIAYDPVRRLAYHGSDTSAPALTVRLVDGDKLDNMDDTPMGSTVPGGGGSVVLSPDRAWLYHGAIQVSVPNIDRRRATFPEVIFAASRDVAFGERGYYRAADGTPLGKWNCTTTDSEWKVGIREPRAAGPAIAVSPDGRSVWMIDRDKNAARQFAIEGDK